MRSRLALASGSAASFAALAVACQAVPAGTAAPAATASASSETPGSGDDGAADRSAGVEGDDQSAPTPPPAALTGPRETPASLVAEADRELRLMRTSSYEHHTSVDESTGRFDYDCSGFLDYALRGAAPRAFAELTAATVPRPLARHFESFFASLPPAAARGHWMHVPRVSDLQPGDVIAWLQPSDSPSKNTGHVLLVHGPVRASEAEAATFFVPVVDSTSLRHGSKDSRTRGEDGFATGLGTGTIVLLADDRGAPSAFRWSSARGSRVRETAIAIGRIVP